MNTPLLAFQLLTQAVLAGPHTVETADEMHERIVEEQAAQPSTEDLEAFKEALRETARADAGCTLLGLDNGLVSDYSLSVLGNEDPFITVEFVVSENTERCIASANQRYELNGGGSSMRWGQYYSGCGDYISFVQPVEEERLLSQARTFMHSEAA